jgi:transketolase
MNVVVPCDSIETERLTKSLLFDVVGPKYLRFAREATPVVTTPDTPLKFGEANVFRLRKVTENFIDAFEIMLASEHENENEDLTIIACGPETAEALRAAWILKTDFDLETRVINMHTVKPMDNRAIIRAALETKAVITAEEHQVGGLGNRVAGVICNEPRLAGKNPPMGMIGVPDRFGESGKSWQLIKEFELAAEFIAKKATDLLKK